MGKRRARTRKPKTPQSVYKHFCKRLSERYGMFCTMSEFLEMSAMVKNGNAEYIDKETCSRSHLVLTWQGVRIRVVYDTKRSLLVTALPKGAG